MTIPTFTIHTGCGVFLLKLELASGLPRGRAGSVTADLTRSRKFSIAIPKEDLSDHECTESDGLIREVVDRAVDVVKGVSEDERVKLFDSIHGWLSEGRAAAALGDYD